MNLGPVQSYHSHYRKPPDSLMCSTTPITLNYDTALLKKTKTLDHFQTPSYPEREFYNKLDPLGLIVLNPDKSIMIRDYGIYNGKA
jgi:hypothetical protein